MEINKSDGRAEPQRLVLRRELGRLCGGAIFELEATPEGVEIDFSEVGYYGDNVSASIEGDDLKQLRKAIGHEPGSFAWAVEQVLAGNTVARPGDSDSEMFMVRSALCSAWVDCTDCENNLTRPGFAQLMFGDLTATDWKVVE